MGLPSTLERLRVVKTLNRRRVSDCLEVGDYRGAAANLNAALGLDTQARVLLPELLHSHRMECHAACRQAELAPAVLALKLGSTWQAVIGRTALSPRIPLGIDAPQSRLAGLH